MPFKMAKLYSIRALSFFFFLKQIDKLINEAWTVETGVSQHGTQYLQVKMLR